MVLEAVMVVVDNSESSRNGDYQPTRFDSQVDAVNVLFQSITQGNPESSVGLMSMGGKGPEVLVTLTTEQGKILEGLHRTKKKIARPQAPTEPIPAPTNNSICLLPVEDQEKELVQLAKKMKKGNISVDFVLFGDLDDDATQKKLQAFNEAVKGNEGSHLVVIPPSSKLLSDQLISTPIMLGEGAGAGAGGAGGNDEFEFGFDPAIEPELALALRMSMEEEKARQEKLAKEQEEEAKKASLESVKEENEASGSGGGADKDKDRGDKMDTS
ncbi:hypothetical protein TrVFT333_008824 [Trichoderma virens FT-333]|nr:hypothetical protein TrVFT333_008824 [Trichoderma virens FT-333]